MEKKSLRDKIVDTVGEGASSLLSGALASKPLAEMPETPHLCLPKNGTSTATARFTKE